MRNTKPKILIIDGSISYTGALKSIVTISNCLRNQLDFFYAIPKSIEVENLLKSYSLAILKINFSEIRRHISTVLYFPNLFINTFRLSRFIRKHGIKVVHVNDLYNMCGVLLKIFRPSIKLIYSIRLLPSSYVRLLYPFWRFLIVRFADNIICVSQAVRKHWPEKKKIIVIYDFIDSEEILSEPAEKDSTCLKFLYLANYIPGKGHPQAINAFQQLLGDYKNKEAKLIMVGGDMGLKQNTEYKSSLQSLCDSLGIANQVIFKDFVSNVELEFKQADIFLNFSESESFSMTCLEAMYFGVPSIVTDCGGPSEIVEHNETGLIVGVNDIQSMSDAMHKLSDNSELMRVFSVKARVRARQLFNPEIQCKKFMRIYSGSL